MVLGIIVSFILGIILGGMATSIVAVGKKMEEYRDDLRLDERLDDIGDSVEEVGGKDSESSKSDI